MKKKPLTIGFDVSWFQAENMSGGVYQYALRLMRALTERTGAIVIALTGDAGWPLAGGEGRDDFRAVKINGCPLAEIVEREGIDIIHSPIQLFPNLTFSVPMVSTLHDLQHIHFPKFFSREEHDYRALFYRQSAVFAERVIVSFQHIKDDVVRHYGIAPDKIDVCQWGVDRPEVPDEESVRAAQKRYGVKTPYLFYSANTWRHKNHLGLIRALKSLRETNKDISLVCTGQKVPDHFPALADEVDKLMLNDAVTFTGYVPEADVRALLKGASLAVIPTLYEAGSFPLVEAMALGVPVICSNVTSLPATIGDERFVFDPSDIKSIVDRSVALLSNEHLRAENILNSKKRISGMHWENAAIRFLESYEKAVEEFQKDKSSASLKEKMIAYELLSDKSVNRLTAEKSALLNSMSWRVTAPLRAALDLFKK